MKIQIFPKHKNKNKNKKFLLFALFIVLYIIEHLNNITKFKSQGSFWVYVVKICNLKNANFVPKRGNSIGWGPHLIKQRSLVWIILSPFVWVCQKLKKTKKKKTLIFKTYNFTCDLETQNFKSQIFKNTITLDQ